MERIVDISSDGLHIAIKRGFLTVAKQGEEQGRVALDDIGAIIAHAHGLTWTNNVFVQCAKRSVPVVLCGSNHAPIAMVWPIEGHHIQAARMKAQIAATKPLQKQIWAEIIRAKIRMQGAVLTANDKEGQAFDFIARQVRSGDPENKEAQAARRYWKALFGKDFKRDVNEDGINSLLNYGYIVLRALVSRAICAAGLHPSIGIFHKNSFNAFALADDVMEPYRPFVDQIVFALSYQGKTALDTETKTALTAIATFDIKSHLGTTPIGQHIHYFVHSIATSFETKKTNLALPQPLSSLSLKNILNFKNSMLEE